MSTLRKKISITALLIASLLIVAHSVVPHHHRDEHQRAAQSAVHSHDYELCSGCDATTSQLSPDCAQSDCAGLLPFVLRMGSDISSEHHLLFYVIAIDSNSCIDSSSVRYACDVQTTDIVPKLIQARIVACLPHRGPPMC